MNTIDKNYPEPGNNICLHVCGTVEHGNGSGFSTGICHGDDSFGEMQVKEHKAHADANKKIVSFLSALVKSEV